MGRELIVTSMGSALANALAGDRHYDGMQAPDGSDISTRSKHREFMKRTGLTTVDDFKGEWSGAAKEREARRSGTHQDRQLTQALEREFYRRTT